MTRRAGVVGSPISHSLSPALHRAAYRALGLDWIYDSDEVTAEQLPSFVDGLDDSWVGLSLTMPLKEAVIDLAQEVDRTVRVTGSANTLLLGSRVVHNTDVAGIEVALRRAGFAAPVGFSATIIGAGATGRSAIVAAHALGATAIHLLARRPERAEGARRTASEVGVALTVEPLNAPERLAAPLVISTVPAGAADVLVADLPEHPGWLLDVVYSPWPTPIADAWHKRGGTSISGLEMLLAQAEKQVELMTGLPAPSQAMRAALPATHA